MMKLTSDNVFWFIYQYNCAVGHPTMIRRRVFEKEFSSPWCEIEPLINQLEKTDGMIIRRYSCVYDLTEKGLAKASAMSQYMQEDVMVTKRFWLEIGQYLVAFYDRMHGVKYLLPLLISAAILPANATTWYVAANGGSDGNDGKSEKTAFATIQYAINQSVAEDLILVDDGVYEPIGTGSKNVRIKSLHGASRTIIDGGHTNIVAHLGGLGSPSVIEGFTVRNGSAPSSAPSGGGVKYGNAVSCVITGNFAKVYGAGCYYANAKNCLIAYNVTGGDNQSGKGGGCYYGQADNCTICVNESLFRGTGNMRSSPGCEKTAMNNCIVWGNFRYAGDVWTESNSYGGSANHCCMENPGFVCASDGDFRLASGSQCVDAGDNSIELCATDLQGKSRIYNGAVDIGAYEYHPAALGGISNIVAQQRYPWNGLVDLSFEIVGESGTAYETSFAANDIIAKTNIQARTLSASDGSRLSVTNSLKPGVYKWIWDASADLPSDFSCERMSLVGTLSE